jgi:CO/xanthine dehydrogenase Mo-binding subunit
VKGVGESGALPAGAALAAAVEDALSMFDASIESTPLRPEDNLRLMRNPAERHLPSADAGSG